jgi:Ser/Thr protein kinase RdoA (MazF antagonist)
MNAGQSGFFFELTPERVLDAVESSGLQCTGRCLALNSFENRVYDVELDDGNRRVVKFYRPARWTEEQILEEHEFLFDLKEAEIPVVSPIQFPDGMTLKKMPGTEIHYALFPKVGGRAPEELSDDQLVRVGRLLGRIHNVGAKKRFQHRVRINPQTYGFSNLEFLLKKNWIPIEFQNRYKSVVEKICEFTEPWFEKLEFQRLHGDCHLGNLLWSAQGPFFLDFDDCVIGPPIQDIWLLVPGRDAEALRQRDVLLKGYCEFRHFDMKSLKLIEPLRSLRFIYYTAWIARRWDDPAFPMAFPHFGTHQYWMREVEDLEDQWNQIQSVFEFNGSFHSS